MANEELFFSGIDLQNRGVAKNTRHLKRTGTVASSATPTINTDVVDYYSITALAANITSFTTNLTGTPNDADELVISITDDGTARTLAFGASFEASAEALPTTTVISQRMDILFRWNTVTSKWRLIDVTTTSTLTTEYSNQTIGDGATQNPILTHTLNTRDVDVTARLTASPYTKVNVNWEATSTTTVTFFIAGPVLASAELTVHVSRI